MKNIKSYLIIFFISIQSFAIAAENSSKNHNKFNFVLGKNIEYKTSKDNEQTQNIPKDNSSKELIPENFNDKKISLLNRSIKIHLNESKEKIILRILNTGKGSKVTLKKAKDGWDIYLKIKTTREINLSNLQSEIKSITNIEIEKIDKLSYSIKVKFDKNYIVGKPSIKTKSNNNIQIDFKDIRRFNQKNHYFPFLNNLVSKKIIVKENKIAIPPKSGDIAIGSVVLQNRGFINLIGPNVSLTLNNSPARDALLKLSKLGGYGFVLSNDDNKNVKNNSASNNQTILDKGPKVTLSFVEEDYSRAFNSILLASGLQAKKSDNLIIVGRNVLGKSFGAQISKVYRLNQARASSAADYLASLGASINKVDTIKSSASGSTESGFNSIKYIDTYSSSTGPLQGLVGTTDSRLQTITLIGSDELIDIAEKYLKQLDVRQRQVALSVKILDVEISKDDSLSNDFALTTGTTFIVNQQGQLNTTFGSFRPPGNIAAPPLPNPGLQYPANEIYSQLMAKIKSKSTKVLANPTLILSEDPKQIQGGTQASISLDGLGGDNSSIGRPFGNESFLILGTKVISGYSVQAGKDGSPPVCQATFDTAGLTFGARVNKIGDNGYVTFSLSPKLSSVSEITTVPNCGPINILSVRRLDTGNVRVRDSETLILTGVISNNTSKVVNKVPILGDIPIFGRAFKSESRAKRNSELIIMVTPKIIDESANHILETAEENLYKETKKLLQNK